MKKTFFVLAILSLVLRLPGQTNAPIRLALISESDDASAAADVLTAKLSRNTSLQLLERNEIEKVYREQTLSAGNRDYLKLGQVLGADGLLLLRTVKDGANQSLNVRLIAVKPGVVLTAEKFPWPLKDLTEWSSVLANHLKVFLPKLAVLAKDAIPISVVNLRSSGPSADIEQELKMLTIQRLSQEPRLFVLERQKLNLLSEEKELKLDDSTFWDGSYLLDGIVDQNGYSKETITINARLTPPKGGTPVSIEVSGSRTNLTEVVNQLAAKIDEALKIKSAVKEWSAADEAAQYFAEAKWAFGWGVLPEAQTAADSAWALGKQDLDCATVRVTAYMNEIPSEADAFQTGEITFSPGYNADGVPVTPFPSDAIVQTGIQKTMAEHAFWKVYTLQGNGARVAHFVFASRQPEPKDVDISLHALELYYDFCRTSSQGEPKLNTDWYRLGIENLILASSVLQQFCLVPEAQTPVAEKLSELRALARSVAEVIARSPSVHDIYYVGDRTVTSDELNQNFFNPSVDKDAQTPNIFECAIKWGCFWQERPEDGIALYRKLMNSPLFARVHAGLWFREPEFPRLAAWNAEDEKHLPEVWRSFMEELSVSTNLFYQLEEKAMTCADAGSEEWTSNTDMSVIVHFKSQQAEKDKKVRADCDALYDFLSTNYEAIVAVNDHLLRFNWGVDSLFGKKSEYAVKFTALQQQQAQASENREAYEKQKQFLLAKKPFNPQEFTPLFLMGFKDYSKAQAQEILPLLAAYKASLAGTWAGIGTMQVGQVEANANRILNPPAPTPQPQVQVPSPKPAAVVKAPAPPASNIPPETATNILTVNKFLAIPLDGLTNVQDSSVMITAHQWIEGKLLLDFQYGTSFDKFDKSGAWQETRMATKAAIAILDPATEHWDVIDGDEVGNGGTYNFYHRSTLLHGELFNCDNGQIKKYDFQNRQWQVLPISDGGTYELFAVNGHLYAANGSMIFEILDGGKSTCILASTRRQPPVSALDTENLWTPTLFEGPEHSLRVSTRSKIFTWTDTDWREDCAAPPVSYVPVVFEDGILFLTDGLNQPARISCLLTESSAVEFCLGQDRRPGFNPGSSTSGGNVKPMWKLPPELSLPNLPAAIRQSDLYLLVDHSEARDIIDERQHEIVGRKMLAKDGYHAELLCFSPDLPLPQKAFLKFDDSDGCPPVTGKNPNFRMGLREMPPVWMLFTTNFLFFGLESPNVIVPSDGNLIGIGNKVGVWVMPLEKIDRVLADQKQAQHKAHPQNVASEKPVQQTLLAKYDRNHNGVIDPDEREELLDNSGFIESELGVIDANQNGWLDPEELAYFDANNNEVLDPKEQAGIDIALHLLAERLLKKFDANGDGVLDLQEFSNLMRSRTAAGSRPAAGFAISYPDKNHDERIDVAELETFLKQMLFRDLQPRQMPGQPHLMIPPARADDANQPELFKAAVESYWRNPGGVTDRPPFDHRVPFHPGQVPNGMPPGTGP